MNPSQMTHQRDESNITLASLTGQIADELLDQAHELEALAENFRERARRIRDVGQPKRELTESEKLTRKVWAANLASDLGGSDRSWFLRQGLMGQAPDAPVKVVTDYTRHGLVDDDGKPLDRPPVPHHPV